MTEEQEDSFADDLSVHCLTVRITSGMAKMSASIGEITSAAVEQFSLEADQFDKNFTASLMPKAKKQRIKQFSGELRTFVKELGVAKVDEGRGVDYYVMIGDLPELYAKYDEVYETMQQYIKDDVLSDWDAYKASVIESLGDIESPEKYFPYESKEDYAKEFLLNIHVDVATNPSMLPATLVDEYLKDKVEESMREQTNTLITRLRSSLAEELVQLRTRLLGSDIPVTPKTFNSIRKTLAKSQQFSMGHDPNIDRVVAGVTKLVDYIESNPEKVVDDGTRASSENVFNQCLSLLAR